MSISPSVAHSALSRVSARRIAKPLAEPPREMRIVAKAASVGDFAERLARTQQRPAVEQMGGMIKPARTLPFRHPGHAHAFTGALASCKENRIVTRYVGAEPADCEVRIERQSGLRGGPCLVRLTKPR
jgi:hypothetical protein